MEHPSGAPDKKRGRGRPRVAADIKLAKARLRSQRYSEKRRANMTEFRVYLDIPMSKRAHVLMSERGLSTLTELLIALIDAC